MGRYLSTRCAANARRSLRRNREEKGRWGEYDGGRGEIIVGLRVLEHRDKCDPALKNKSRENKTTIVLDGVCIFNEGNKIGTENTSAHHLIQCTKLVFKWSRSHDGDTDASFKGPLDHVFRNGLKKMNSGKLGLGDLR